MHCKADTEWKMLCNNTNTNLHPCLAFCIQHTYCLVSPISSKWKQKIRSKREKNISMTLQEYHFISQRHDHNGHLHVWKFYSTCYSMCVIKTKHHSYKICIFNSKLNFHNKYKKAKQSLSLSLCTVPKTQSHTFYIRL